MGRSFRVVWTVVSLVLVETLIVAVAAVIPIALWTSLAHHRTDLGSMMPVLIAASLVPAYALFAFVTLIASTIAARLLGWRTVPGLSERVSACSWAVLDWARGLGLTHCTRVLAGPAFRSTPAWTWYLRWNGARVGRRVYVNSLALMDHSLLTIGDDVVIGSDVHLSGHVIQGGTLSTAHVLIGSDVSIGVGSVIETGVVIDDHVRIAALSLVTKFSRLAGSASYGGAPVHALAASHRQALEERR